MEIEIIAKGKEALIRDRTNNLEIARLKVEGGIMEGVPKGDYEGSISGIPYSIKCSGNPINLSTIFVDPAEIANMIARNYLRENNQGGRINWK